MKLIAIVSLAGIAAFSLSGCAAITGEKGVDSAALITALKTAPPGCAEKTHIEGGGGTGQIGGEVHGSFMYDRNCTGKDAPGSAVAPGVLLVPEDPADADPTKQPAIFRGSNSRVSH